MDEQPSDAGKDSGAADEIARLRDELLRFAVLQLRDRSAAEDAVQEAIAAALDAQGRFKGNAKLKTWVFAILKNKIIDTLRERARHRSEPFDESESDADLARYFDARGAWLGAALPRALGEPEAALADQQFWRVFEVCVTELPEGLARAFMMREFLGLETAEICDALSISASNCWVMLHRARLRLRACLEHGWLAAD